MDSSSTRPEKSISDMETATEVLARPRVQRRETLRETRSETTRESSSISERRHTQNRGTQRSTYSRRRVPPRKRSSFLFGSKEQFFSQLMVSGILVILVVVIVTVNTAFTTDLRNSLKAAFSETTEVESVTAFYNIVKETAGNAVNSVGTIFGYQMDTEGNNSTDLPTKGYINESELNTQETETLELEMQGTNDLNTLENNETTEIVETTKTAEETRQNSNDAFAIDEAYIDDDTLNQINASVSDEKNE